MDKKALIAQYLKDHPQPNSEKTPEVVLKWISSKNHVKTEKFYLPIVGKVYDNHYPGEDEEFYRGTVLTPTRKYLTQAGKPSMHFLYMQYADYDPVNKMMAFGYIRLDINKPDPMKNSDKRQWHYGVLSFLFRDDPVPYTKEGDPWSPGQQKTYFNKSYKSYFRDWSKLGQTAFTCQEVRDFFDARESLPYNKMIDQYWGRERAYEKMIPRPETGRDKLAQELLKYELKDFHEYEASMPVQYKKDTGSRLEVILNYSVYEQINEDTGVIRLLERNIPYGTLRGTPTITTINIPFNQERARLYLHKDKMITMCPDLYGKRWTLKTSSALTDPYETDVLCNYEGLIKLPYYAKRKGLLDKLYKYCSENNTQISRDLQNNRPLNFPYALTKLFNTPLFADMINKEYYNLISSARVNSYFATSAAYKLAGDSSKRAKTVEELAGMSPELLKTMDSKMGMNKWGYSDTNMLRRLFTPKLQTWTQKEIDQHLDMIRYIGENSLSPRLFPMRYGSFYHGEVAENEEVINARKIFNLFLKGDDREWLIDILDSIYTSFDVAKRNWSDRTQYEKMQKIWKESDIKDLDALEEIAKQLRSIVK